jgi:hypothetical protein
VFRSSKAAVGIMMNGGIIMYTVHIQCVLEEHNFVKMSKLRTPRVNATVESFNSETRRGM